MRTITIILILIVIVLEIINITPMRPFEAQVRKDVTAYVKGVAASENIGKAEETDSCAWALDKAKTYAIKAETEFGGFGGIQLSMAYSDYYRACKGR